MDVQEHCMLHGLITTAVIEAPAQVPKEASMNGTTAKENAQLAPPIDMVYCIQEKRLAGRCLINARRYHCYQPTLPCLARSTHPAITLRL